MSRITLAAAAGAVEGVEIEIDSCLFTPVPVTRRRAREIAELNREFAIHQADENNMEVPAGDWQDRNVELIGQLLDLWLIPAEGKRRKPSAVLKAMWEGEKVTMPQILGLLGDIAQVLGRPT